MTSILNWFAGKPSPTRRTARSASLNVESLEGRQVPATLSVAVDYGEGKTVTIHGTLSGLANPSLQMIEITGEVMASTYTNSQGEFSVTDTAGALGDVTATYVPMMMMDPGTSATLTLTDVVPTLTFSAYEHAGRLWELVGEVTYSRGAGNLVVYFGGSPQTFRDNGSHALTDSTGHYADSEFLNGTWTDNGTATAVVYTPWNTPSEEAYAHIQQSGVY